jgi:hypothetical protein
MLEFVSAFDLLKLMNNYPSMDYRARLATRYDPAAIFSMLNQRLKDDPNASG